MERIFFVQHGNLKEVNDWLQKGGRVKMIQTSATANEYSHDDFTYIVIEFD